LGKAYTCFPAPIAGEAELVLLLRAGEYFSRQA
jgi:hypothetical protein